MVGSGRLQTPSHFRHAREGLGLGIEMENSVISALCGRKTLTQSLFSLQYKTLPGHKDKIKTAKTDIHKQFLSHRVVDSWNLLSLKDN